MARFSFTPPLRPARSVGDVPVQPGEPRQPGGRVLRVPRRRPGGRRQRTERILGAVAVRDAIVSFAGLVGRPVRNQAGDEIGDLADVVARWSDGQTYPPVTGLVVRVGRRLAFVDASAIDRVAHAEVVLRTARLDLRDFSRRPGEVMLSKDVLDHQLVDVDGKQVIRAADLYLAPVLAGIRLVGVDVSPATLLRRLGPRRWRARPTPDRVIDWAAIQPFDTSGGDLEVRLRTSHDGLHRLRPGELADLLESLRRPERQELLAALSPDEAADALEEMEAEDLTSLLREADPAKAAELLVSMEPDEAVDALRDLAEDERTALLGRMPTASAARLVGLLEYPENEAGGFMTTTLITARTGDSAAEVVDRLSAARAHDVDIDAVAVVDDDGRLVGDLPLLDLLLAVRSDPDARTGDLLDDEEPVTVEPETRATEVARRLIDSRRLSLLVVKDGCPIGRILADDVLDAVVSTRGRFHFPQLFE
ncbi:MAG TPA: CBS domain-containing protein [Acidimicrobiales bacterium]|nr:CBS domain-containing protein [Acidimicrobiales bacterium]